MKWSAPVDLAESNEEDEPDLSCTSDAFCGLANFVDNGDLSIYNGHTWGHPQTVFTEGGGLVMIPAISCAGADFCAAGSLGAIPDILTIALSVYTGKGWSVPENVFTHAEGNQPSLSCATPSFCVVAASTIPPQGGTAEEMSVYNGHRWSKPDTVFPNDNGFGDVIGLSCPATNFCVASDEDPNVGGVLSVYSGNGWSAPQAVFSYNQGAPPLVSCGGVNACMASDFSDQGSTVEYGVVSHYGTTWRASKTLFGNYVGEIPTVQCVAANFCVIADTESDLILSVYNGRTWSKPELAFPSAINFITTDLSAPAISCAEKNFCLATDYTSDYLLASIGTG